MPEEQPRPRLEVRLDVLGVDVPLHLVRREDDDEIGLLHRVADREHAQPFGLGLGSGRAALGEPDPHVDAGVAQVEGVGVALAPVADDGDLLALDDRQVGVVVVQHLGHRGHSFGWWFRRGMVEGTAGRLSCLTRWRSSGWLRAHALRSSGWLRAHALRSARSVIERGPRPTATIPDWTSSRTPKGSSTAQQGLHLVELAGALDGEAVRGHVDDLGAEQLCGLDDVRAGRGVGADLDEHDLTLDRRRRLELDHLEHLDQLVQLLGHLLEGSQLDVDDEGHPRDVGVLGRADGKAVDVEAAAGEQRGNAGQDAGLVLDEHGQGVLGHDGFPQSSRSHSGAPPRAIWILSLLTPAGTIGQTMASRCTTKSMTTGLSLMARAFSMVASTCSSRSQRMPSQP